MIFLFNRLEEVIEIIPKEKVISSTQYSKLKGLIEHIFEAVYSESLDHCFYFGMLDPLDSSQFWMYKVINRKKSDGTIQLEGIHKFFDDLKARGYVKDIRPSGVQLAVPMNQVLEETGWSIGLMDVSNTSSTNVYYESRLTGFWKLIDAWRCEFKIKMQFTNGKISSQTIDFKPKFEEDNGRIYVHGDRLLYIDAESSEENVATAFLGRGKGVEIVDEEGSVTGGFGRKLLFDEIEWSIVNGDPIDKALGSPILELTNQTQEYGYADGKARLQIVNFDDIEDANELLQATYDFALTQSRPKVQYSASVVDERVVSLGEKVRIKRDDLGIAYSTRVWEIKRSFLSSSIQEIRFGDQLTQSRASQVINQRKEAQKKEEQYLSYLDQVVNNLSVDFNNKDGYNYNLEANNSYGLPAGYYSFDKPIDENPTEVVGISAGKLVISNEKNATGQWEFRTFGTGSGLVADTITTGTFDGQLVRAGSIQSGALSVEATSELLSDMVTTTQFDIVAGQVSTVVNKTDELENQFKTELSQTAQGFEMVFSNLSKLIDDIGGDLEKEFNELKRYIRFIDGSIHLGDVASDISLILENDILYFNQGGKRVAYLSNNKLYVVDGEFLNSLRLGNFAFMPRNNGSLDFNKV